MPSSQAPTTAPARCTTCAPTRRWMATRTAAWRPASRLCRSPTQAALSSPATTTSTATSGTHWRQRKLVSGDIHSAVGDKTCFTKKSLYSWKLYLHSVGTRRQPPHVTSYKCNFRVINGMWQTFTREKGKKLSYIRCSSAVFIQRKTTDSFKPINVQLLWCNT